MKAYEIKMFRERLQVDPDNLNIRRVFHEQYEWLESYLKEKYVSNEIDKFCSEYHQFFWTIDAIRNVARKLSFHYPVGSSSFNYEPTEPIKRATYFLRHKSNLVEGGTPEVAEEIELADKWNKTSFHALMFIIKQIRDNLFHGGKMDLNDDQYERNKTLIGLAVEYTTCLLNNLEAAENK